MKGGEVEGRGGWVDLEVDGKWGWELGEIGKSGERRVEE